MNNRIFLILAAFFVLFASGCELVRNDDFDIVPSPMPLPESVITFTEQNYPEFTLHRSEADSLCDDTPVLEVELEHGTLEDLYLYFTPTGEFLFSALEVNISDIPDGILAIITADYPEYTISDQDNEIYTFPDGSVQFQLELIGPDGEDYDLVLNEDGSLFCFYLDHDDDDSDDDDSDDDNNDDDGDGSDVSSSIPDTVLSWIQDQYPTYRIDGAEREDICDNEIYYKVELEDDGETDIDLYFDLNWELQLVATEISLDALPEAVLTGASNDFPDYQISSEDDVERFDLVDGHVQYAFELYRNGGEEIDVVYGEDGSLICTDDDDDDDDDDGDDDDGNDDDDSLSNIPDTVRLWIQDQYPTYRIDGAEREDICDNDTYYKVELEDDGETDIELYFDLNWEFQFTATEISNASLPAIITDQITIQFPGYSISDDDDTYEFVYVDGRIEYYLELSNDDNEIEVLFSAEGALICRED